MKVPGWCSSVRALVRTGGGKSSKTSRRHLPAERRRCESTGCCSHGLAPKGRPDLLRVGVVRLVDVLIRQLAVEGLFGWELDLFKARQESIYSWEYTSFRMISLHHASFCSYCDLESLSLVRRHQLVKRCEQKLIKRICPSENEIYFSLLLPSTFEMVCINR